MENHKSFWSSETLRSLWPAEQEEDTYEVETLVPLPEPHPFTWNLNDYNAIVVNTSISCVSHKANGHLLKVVSKISLPTPPYTLEHARATQTELVRESIKRKQETTDLLRCQEELQERLNEEAKAREHLALELSKAEGLLDGYTDERVFLEKQMQEKNDLIRHLEQELQNTGNRLQELEQERQQIQEEKELLSRQKLALKAGAAPAEQRLVEAAVGAAPKEELLEETEKLLKEKIEVQRQAEKDSGDLGKHVKVLEVELEEQVNRYVELEQEKNAVLEDLRQKNLSLEKQLEKTRRFLDEQAVDREHERDVFQQEIQKLEQQLKMPQRHQAVEEDQNNEVGKLEGHLKEKTDKCCELLLCKEQLQRDVQERNEEIEKLESRIRELEQALLISADTLQKAQDRRPSAAGVKGEMPLEAQLQVEREAIDRKEKEITNLVEQLEQFREELENKNEEVQQLHMQLEIQRKESSTRLQELAQENNVLKGDLEVSHHGEDSSPSQKSYRQETMEEEEIELLNEQIGKLQVQLDADNKVIEEKSEQIKAYKSQIKCLKSEQEQLKRNSEEEIEKLNEVIEKLQEELSNMEQMETVGFTSMAEIAGIRQFSEMAERNDLPSLSVYGDTDDTVSEGKKDENNGRVPKASDVVPASVQDRGSQLQQLLQSVKEKDLNLKQYFDQVATLRVESQALQGEIERLKSELSEKDKRLTDMEASKTELHTVSPPTLALGKEEVFLNSELEATKTELQSVKEELEKIQRSSEHTKNNAVAPVQSQEEAERKEQDTNDKAIIESLTESLREKTAEHLTVEALLLSVQEASHNTICELQHQLQNLQKSQIKELGNNSQLLENQEILHLNEVIRILQNNLTEIQKKISVDTSDRIPCIERQNIYKETSVENTASNGSEEGQTKELSAEEDLERLKEELNQLRESQKHMEVGKENGSRGDDTRQPGLVIAFTGKATIEKTEQSFDHSLPENTSQTTVHNIELQLQEPHECIKLNDSDLLQFINQKDLLDRQVQEIERLNNEIRTLKQALAQRDSGGMINDRECPISVIEPLENRQSPPQMEELDKLVHTKAELEKAEITEELMKALKHDDVKVESTSAVVNIANPAFTVVNEDPNLREKTAELLVSQTICISLEETTQDSIKNTETQLQEMQRVLELKDLELLQYTQQKDHQTREVERLNELVKTLKQQLTDVDPHVRDDKGSSRQPVLNDEGLSSHKTEFDCELVNTKSELEKARTELAVMKEELSKVRLSQQGDISSLTFTKGEADLKVPDLEQGLKDKAAEHPTTQTLVHSMEVNTQATSVRLESLEELQKIIQLKDSELLQYVQQKDLLDQQTREVDRLNEIVKALQQQLSDMDSDGKHDLNEGKGSSKEEFLVIQKTLQKKELEDNKYAQAKSDKAKTEQALLKEEPSKTSLAPKHEIHGQSQPIDREKELGVNELEQTLREKTAELESLENTTKATINNLESQLIALQKIIDSKDSELLQYVSLKDLVDQQKEGVHINEVVNSTEALLENEALLAQNTEGHELITLKKESERMRMDLALLTEELAKLRAVQKQDTPCQNSSEKDETAQATIYNMTAQLQELQNVIQLKDSEQVQYVNQKALIDQQTREIEHLNELIKTYQLKLEEHGSDVRDGHSGVSEERLPENQMLLLQNTRQDCDELTQAKAELDRTKMDLCVLTEEVTELGVLHKLDDKQHRNTSEEDINVETARCVSELEKALMVKTEELLASQNLFVSLEETSEKAINALKQQLNELEKVVKQKDSELLQYMNQKNTVQQQTKEIEQLNSIIESLQKQVEYNKQETSIEKCESASKESMKEFTQQMNVDGKTIMRTAQAAYKELEQPSTLSTQENVLVQEPLQETSVHTDNPDEDDWVVEALRDKATQLLANQTLFTATQETMQSTIDALEGQMAEVQEIIKEKDAQILLYSKEIKALKEQVNLSTSEHGQVVLAMEDSLREKVAAALVSEAQLKAIQVHTKCLHEDNTSSYQEASTMIQDSGFKHPHLEESETKLSALNLKVLELEKQLLDLHEQLQIERDQADLAHQLAAERERQLDELQQVLESTKAKQAMNLNQKQEELGDVALLQESIDPFKSHTKYNLEQQLQDLTEESTATKEELCHYRELSETLRGQLMEKETSLAHLEEDLREVKKCLGHAEEKLAFYMKREIQEEQLQNTSGIDFTDAARSPDWNTSSSQTDKVLSVNSSNQTLWVPEKHVGIQKNLDTSQLRTSDEVDDLIEQYTDKISQMQELHAAEILDMEARHITETESLRRDQYAVVQALNEECDALKAVIEALKSSGEGVPNSALSASYHFTDAASSDVTTECDWSQGTCDVQSLDQLPEGLRGDEDIPSELIPNKIKDLLRAVHQEGMQVLSLTEATSPEKEPPFKVQKRPWHEERKALLETIASLKELIAKMQIYKDSEGHTRSDFHGLSPDWRGELLRAIQEVFHREQDVLMSAFHTQLASLGRYDANALLNQMQHRLQEQGVEQINAMDCIQNADRRSLLLEIQDLRAQLTSLHGEPEIQSLYHPNDEAGGAPYVQQEQPLHSQELHIQLNSMNMKASELQGQLGSEKLLSAEIKNELALTKMELESNLKLQHKHFKELESLRTELKRKREELDSLNEALANEQKKSRELQYALEKQQTKKERQDLQDQEKLEDVQILLEEQKSRNLDINKQLEEERKLVKDLQQQIVSRGSTYDTEVSQERSRVLELQVLLAAEKARSSELSKAIECQQGLEAHLQNTEVDGQPGKHKPDEDLLRELKGQLDSKHAHIVELVSEVEVYKLECVQLRRSLEEERQSLQKGFEAEKETSRLALKQVEELTATVKDLECQMQKRVAEISRYQAEEKKLKETIQSLQSRPQDREETVSERRDLAKTSTTRKSLSKSESSKLPLQTVVPNLLCPDPLSVVNGDLGTEQAPLNIDQIKQRLQQVSSKLKQLATKANKRIAFEKEDNEDLTWSQNSIQDVLSQLEHIAILSLQGQNLVLPAGMSANTLTEKLLTQNAELTGYVSRLTEEKSDLQNSLLRLEGEVSRYRARRPSADYSTVDNAVNIDALLAAERESWSREKLNLRRSLKQAEAELSKVKAELRNEVAQRDLSRDTDNIALKRIYGKYLRSESYRKALVYQKKYLLLLLGGFQECEDATLALIARMGGQPAYTDLEVITNHSRAFTRFRSAARVAVAISRMKFLVRRWQRATISTISVISRNSFGQNAGNEVRSDSAYHPARSMELYGEQRISSCRSQSGFNSPQSTVNSQHRYISASDASPCSHLQHYDPDKALTDYIARLEALQKRLGTVSSGASPSTHYSVRR